MMPCMRLTAGALALAGILSSAVSATALPMSPGSAGASFASPESGLVQKVSGCHKHPEYHFVYQWGRQAWHRHGNNCAPRPANPPVKPLPYPQPYPGYNPYPTPGYPVAPAYCHNNWQNHFHPGFGAGWHKHAGPNCTPVRGRQWKGGPKTGCINIAGIWICG